MCPRIVGPLTQLRLPREPQKRSSQTNSTILLGYWLNPCWGSQSGQGLPDPTLRGDFPGNQASAPARLSIS
jgi:hypothetical protein